jgi:PAP2 superfamily
LQAESLSWVISSIRRRRPRLAGIGIADTVSNGSVDLNHGLVSMLYNPYAAVPSMHIGYALVVGASLLRHGGRGVVRLLGAIYPLMVLVIIVATGNHFFVDAAVGSFVAALAAAVATVLTRRTAVARISAVPATSGSPRRQPSLVATRAS